MYISYSGGIYRVWQMSLYLVGISRLRRILSFMGFYFTVFLPYFLIIHSIGFLSYFSSPSASTASMEGAFFSFFSIFWIFVPSLASSSVSLRVLLHEKNQTVSRPVGCLTRTSIRGVDCRASRRERKGDERKEEVISREASRQRAQPSFVQSPERERKKV